MHFLSVALTAVNWKEIRIGDYQINSRLFSCQQIQFQGGFINNSKPIRSERCVITGC